MDWRTVYQEANPFLLEGISISLIIQKFGGSSVRDSERLLRAAEIIGRTWQEGHDVVVVFSAQGDTTDILLEKAYELSKTPSARELDALLATGENASVALGAILLLERGIPAVSLSGAQVPIKTDGTHGNALVLNVGKRRILRELKRRRVVLVAGFQGVDEAGDITTLGRGGSDLTAVALAAHLRADRCQIYTDVDGVYTTDPRICQTARRLEKVSYDHMLTLAAQGAQVLHDRSVEFAQRHGVVLEVLSCAEGSVGSCVVETADCGAVTGLTRKKLPDGASVAITAVGQGLPDAEKTAQVRAMLQAQDIPAFVIRESREQLTVLVDAERSDRALCLMHDALLGT